MKNSKHLIASKTIIAAALAFGIGIAPLTLTACGGQSAETAAETEAAPQAEAADLDLSSWKTLGDGLSQRTGDMSYGFDDELFVGVFTIGDTQIRAVCQSTPDLSEKLAPISFEDPDYDSKLNEALADLELLSVEEISSTMLSQEELDSYVGKTGQDMYDAGFVFDYYFFYGGEQTGVTMGNGYYSYEVTFDASVSEDQTEDNGASIKDATVVEIQSMGNLSNAALDPSAVK